MIFISEPCRRFTWTTREGVAEAIGSLIALWS